MKSRFVIVRLNVAKYILATFVLPVAVLYFSGILKPLELALYDFNFLLRSPEPTDKRIVLVEWDEDSIQTFQESTISDSTLSSVLDKIQQQQPSVIGLDLYRDVPVFSPRLSDRVNVKAYNSLQNSFGTVDNLVGIEKTIEPKINPPLALKERELIAAADLPSDRDNLIRRAYIFPQQDAWGKAVGIPTLGVALAYQYLADRGWNAERVSHNTLKISKENDSIVLKPLGKSSFAGILRGDLGLYFLVNWHKGKANFSKISVSKLVKNKIAADFFRDRLVIIGNVSTSTADRHYIPTNRWNHDEKSWIYGVQVQAQIASSIINAAVNDRSLITPLPTAIQFVLSLALVGVAGRLLSKAKIRSSRHIWKDSLYYCIFLSMLLMLGNFVLFELGCWVPVAETIIYIWIAYFSINYYLYTKQKRENVSKLEMFVRDLQHSLGNPVHSIASSTNRIDILTKEISDNKVANPQATTTIFKRVNNIQTQIKRIERYRKRTKEFVNFTYLKKANATEIIDINQFVQEIVSRFLEETEYANSILLLEKYDPNLTFASIDPVAIEIVLENLLDNAFRAVTSKHNRDMTLAKVKVQTLLDRGRIILSVEDTGLGIPPSMRHKIFLPFVSSYSNGQGIGLYLIKEISSLYQGEIEVESKEGCGSKFTFSIKSM